jgi:hypothetical protein
VCNADACDYRRVAKDGWRAGEVVKESNSEAKKNRHEVDVDFVEEASIQELLDGVGAMNPNGLPGGGGFGLVHGAFDAVVEVGDLAVERHGHDCDNLRHCVLLSSGGNCVQGIAPLLRKRSTSINIATHWTRERCPPGSSAQRRS